MDQMRGLVYVATGNNYSAPDDVLDCVAKALKGNSPKQEQKIAACNPDDNYVNSVLAMDIDTGEIQWAHRASSFDFWNVDCIGFLFGIPANGTCPDPTGPDFDFAQGPALYSPINSDGGVDDEILGAGQKSGVYWGLNPDTGEVLWQTQVGPGGVAGGLQWGSATDRDRIYAAVANSDFKEWTLLDGSTINSGFWAAIDAETGERIWETPDPNFETTPGMVTIANGVVFAGSLAPNVFNLPPDPASVKNMFALDAETGEILWEFASGGSVNSGAAVVNGVVYWGTGYSPLFTGVPSNKLFAFDLM